jgi:hypothetical protein
MNFYTFRNIRMMFTYKFSGFSHPLSHSVGAKGDVNSQFSPVLLFVTITGWPWALPPAIFNLAASVRLRPNLDARISSIVASLCLNPERDPAIFKIL